MKLSIPRVRRLAPTALVLVLPLALACGESSPTDTETPPVVAISTPAADTETDDMDYVYDGHDEALGLWYKDVAVAGTATDAEDGALGGSALAWTTDRTDLQDAALGTGGAATVRLYSDVCTGTWHEVSLTATDSDGDSATATRRIFIWTLC